MVAAYQAEVQSTGSELWRFDGGEWDFLSLEHNSVEPAKVLFGMLVWCMGKVSRTLVILDLRRRSSGENDGVPLSLCSAVPSAH